MSAAKRRIVVAMTGASGAVYGLRLLEELLRDKTVEVHLILSRAAQKILETEHGLRVDAEAFDPAALNVAGAKRLVCHRNDDLAAPIASGSFRVDAMAVVPCSMGCVSAIAHGASDDLIERAADVMLKERRPLIVVPREMPFSALHLENLLALARMGVTVMPACPGFYGKPQTVAEIVDFVVARVLDHLGVAHRLGPRWGAS
jgi:4-hydroxy-3-polyprenylbenzoate decarboxylase